MNDDVKNDIESQMRELLLSAAKELEGIALDFGCAHYANALHCLNEGYRGDFETISPPRAYYALNDEELVSESHKPFLLEGAQAAGIAASYNDGLQRAQTALLYDHKTS